MTHPDPDPGIDVDGPPPGFDRCPACGSTELAGFVQHGSYFTGCARCGTALVATSWIAIADTFEGRLRAVVVDAEGRPAADPIEGDAAEVAPRIGELAGRGLRVRLLPSA